MINLTLQPAGVNKSVNYTLQIATEDTMARILEWFIRRPAPMSWYKNIVRNPSEKQRKFITLAMRHAPAHLLETVRKRQGHNIVPSVLRDTLASMTAGTVVTPTFSANEIAMGSGTTTPANTDTQLLTETLRGVFDDRYSITNTAYLDKFFPVSDVAGNTYQEVGIFVDGEAAPDTGFLLSRILLEATFAANETLTLNATVAYTSA